MVFVPPNAGSFLAFALVQVLTGDELYCLECDTRRADRICDQCGDWFCENCFAATHAKGRRMRHTWTPWGKAGVSTGWEEFWDEDKQIYVYFNKVTKESRSTKPPELMWGTEREEVIRQQRENLQRARMEEQIQVCVCSLVFCRCRRVSYFVRALLIAHSTDDASNRAPLTTQELRVKLRDVEGVVDERTQELEQLMAENKKKGAIKTAISKAFLSPKQKAEEAKLAGRQLLEKTTVDADNTAERQYHREILTELKSYREEKLAEDYRKALKELDVLAEQEEAENSIGTTQSEVDDFWTDDQLALKEKRMEEYEIKKSLGLIE